jgi:hypothetical protein
MMPRPVALALTASLIAPSFLAGCDGGQQAAVPPPRDATSGEMTRMNPSANQPNQGMSTRKKLAILAGAAALYYIYKKKQRENAAPANVQYYLSKSTGRVYYRDPKTHQAIWVTPPPNQAPTIQIPESEAMDYRDMRGYNNQNTGRELSHYFETR